MDWFWVLNLLGVVLLLTWVPRDIERYGFGLFTTSGLVLIVVNTYFVGIGLSRLVWG